MEVYRMGACCGMSPAASLMKLHIQLHGGNCVDSHKAVVLVLPQWWKDVLRQVYWSCKGVGITLDSELVLEACEHLGQYSSEAGVTISWCAPGSVSLESATELGGHVWKDTQAWKGWGTLAWVDSA